MAQSFWQVLEQAFNNIVFNVIYLNDVLMVPSTFSFPFGKACEV